MKRLLGALAITSLLLLVACLSGMDVKCDEHQVRDIPAPGAKIKAVELHSVCERNVYVATIDVAGADGNRRATAMHAQLVARTPPPAWPDLKLDWKSEKELWITYPPGVDVTCVSNPPGVTVHCLDASIMR